MPIAMSDYILLRQINNSVKLKKESVCTQKIWAFQIHPERKKFTL